MRRLDPSAKRAAEVSGVDIRFYDIIYKLTEDIEAALTGYAGSRVPGGA